MKHKTFAEKVAEVVQPVSLTSEQLTAIAAQIPATDISGKVDKIIGKGLSTNDFTDAEETKLAGIETDANNYIHPANHNPSVITQDISNRFVSDTEKSAWNGKEPGNSNIQTHISSAHAPSNAQKNSDITKEEIETKLTGEITTHTHPGGSGGLTQAQILKRQL